MARARLGAQAVAVAAIAGIAALAGCSRGTIEGQLDYMDSSWDMGATISAAAPPIAVRLIPGGEGDARGMIEGWVAARAGDPGSGIPPWDGGLAEWIMSHEVEGGTVVDSVTVCPRGLFEFSRVRKGRYLVLADYESDIGYFAWLVPVELKGMTSPRVELNWDNKIALEVLKPLPTATVRPPGLEELKKIEEGIPPHPETIEVTVPAGDAGAAASPQAP